MGRVSEASTPEWLLRVRPALDADVPDWFDRFTPPPDPRRHSAVLMLFGDDAAHGTDVVLTERAHSLRSHAAQVAFPGGHLDGEEGPIDAAVREAEEEAGVDPGSVEIVSTLPPLYMHPTGTSVTPVLAWWRTPHPLVVGHPEEVAQVVRAPVRDLLEPANRFSTRMGEYTGPGFDVCGLYVWGFTATLLDHVFDLAGLGTPWDRAVERPIPEHLTRAYRRW